MIVFIVYCICIFQDVYTCMYRHDVLRAAFEKKIEYIKSGSWTLNLIAYVLKTNYGSYKSFIIASLKISKDLHFIYVQGKTLNWMSGEIKVYSVPE